VVQVHRSGGVEGSRSGGVAGSLFSMEKLLVEEVW
jgi:hypothetical protein